MENSLATIFSPAAQERDKTEEEEGAPHPAFLLEATHVTLEAVRRCWAPDVYVDALAHRFWKLTLQIVSRYAGGAAKAPEMVVPAPPEQEPGGEDHQQQQHLRASVTTVNLKDVGAGGAFGKGLTHSRSASFTLAQQQMAEAAEAEKKKKEEERYRSRPAELIRLWLDVRDLAEHLQGTEMRETILPRLGEMTESQVGVVTGAMEEGCERLKGERSRRSFFLCMYVLYCTCTSSSMGIFQ